MKQAGKGRPRSRLKPTTETLTRRVRILIDHIHDGNVLEASNASGIPYATIRDLYTGKTTNPGVQTLRKLAMEYLIYPEWFTDPEQPDAIPNGGVIVKLREILPGPPYPYQREVLIPMAAPPLPWVFTKGSLILESMAPDPSRPILGDSEDEDECNLRFAEAILHPLLVAEREGLIPRLGSSWNFDEDKSLRDAHVPLMKHVGKFWEAVLLGYDSNHHSLSKARLP